MYIFSRTARFKPEHQVTGFAFAVDIATKVTAVTGKPLSVYTGVFGYPLGTVIWSVRVESHADLFADFTKLAGDAAYMGAAAANSHLFEGTAEDRLLNVVSSSLTAPKPIVATTAAVVANGKLAEAMAFGVKTQECVAAGTGLGTAFSTAAYGPFGGVGWLVGADTMADVDRLFDWEATDAAFQALVTSGGDLFIPGSGQNALIQKLN